jgi:hypothetical protein
LRVSGRFGKRWQIRMGWNRQHLAKGPPGRIASAEIFGQLVVNDRLLVICLFGPPLAVLIAGASLAWGIAHFYLQPCAKPQCPIYESWAP